MVKIIDASVAIKWFVSERGQDAALGILKDLLDDPSEFAVPELFYFELANVFNRLVPNPNKGQIEVLSTVLSLGMHRFSMTRELSDQIRHFQARGLSGYDAAYVALAKIVKGRWLCFDKKAHQKIKHLGLSTLLDS